MDHFTLKPFIHTQRYGIHARIGYACHNVGYKNVITPGSNERGKNGVDNDGLAQGKNNFVKGAETGCTVDTSCLIQGLGNGIEKSLCNVVAECSARRINNDQAQVRLVVIGEENFEQEVNCRHTHKAREHTQNEHNVHHRLSCLKLHTAENICHRKHEYCRNDTAAYGNEQGVAVPLQKLGFGKESLVIIERPFLREEGR